MATERTSMRNIREILRLRWELNLPVRQCATSLGVGVGTVQGTTTRATAAKLTLEDVALLDDTELETLLYRNTTDGVSNRSRPDPVYIHRELRRPGVTLELLHMEFLEQHPDGLRYTMFCEDYRRWLGKAGVVMRQVHRAGEKCFVDFSGKKASYIDPATGEVVDTEVFVATLGASHYTYAEATSSQRVDDFIGAHMRAYAFFGGVTEITVPDQLKSGVVLACRYEPGIQRTYAEMARHYGTAIVPARPRKPRDKAKVEVAVQLVQRWVLARLRHETFFSLAELNARIRELCADLNSRPMKKLGGVTRRELFDKYDRPALRPLPSDPYEVTEWREVRVNLDYHVEVDKHWYSAPNALVHEQLWAATTSGTVSLFHRGKRVAAHARSRVAYKHTTDPAHMPEAHRQHARGVDGVLAWAASVGPMTEAMARRLIELHPIREQGWRSARGLQRVGEKHGPERTEKACTRALLLGSRSYRPVKAILERKREDVPMPGEATAESPPIAHENVRGPDYFH